MLIGRTRELDALKRGLDEVRATGGQAWVLTGEPGIGKSTLLAAIRGLAAERGFAVAATVAWEGAWSPPYAPWGAILEQLGQPPISPPDPGLDPAGYHDVVRRHLLASIRVAASERPVAITADDVQWMDPASRDVLAHAVATLGPEPVLLLGAWRTPVPAPDQEVAAFVAGLFREPTVHHLDLAGLDEPAVAEIARQLGWTAPAEAVRAVTSRTNGNPFFVTELARLKAAEGDASGAAIPPSVQQVVRARLAALPASTSELLGVAAILDRGFDFALLSGMTDLREDALLDALDDALERDFLRPTGERPEHYDFTHQIVRETIAAGWSPSRRVRLHRRAAESLERLYAGRTAEVAGDLAQQYFASRSLAGAERGIPHALASADRARQSLDLGQAVDFIEIAQALAITEPAKVRGEIAVRRALALADALRVEDALGAAMDAVDLLVEAEVAPEVLAHACWQLAHTLNAVGANPAGRKRLQAIGLQALGDRRDLHWARLRLLEDAIAVVPNDVLYAARWLGYDPEAQRMARASGHEDDQVQTIESFDPRNRFQTRELVDLARGWRQPRSILRGLTAAANDLTYRHGEFRQAMRLWHEILDLARETGATPWEANALNQVTLLHVTLGEFEAAVTSKYRADEVNARLGPANDAEALLMERDFALTHYLDGDWAGQAEYWLEFTGSPPQGLETRLAAPLYAAMAASASAAAGVDAVRALRLVDALCRVATHPGIQQLNGVVAWAGDAVSRLGAKDRAVAIDRLAAALIEAGVGDYPQTSLHLTRARMLTLLGDPQAHRLFEQAREVTGAQGQEPLQGIACYEQALAPVTPLDGRKRLLRQAISIFDRLQMTTWHERATAAATDAPESHPDLAGVSRRELEVIRLVAQGYSDRRVADTLFISERTVNAHVRNVLRKTDTPNRTGLSAWARARGILDE